jgi:hypothetical protein
MQSQRSRDAILGSGLVLGLGSGLIALVGAYAIALDWAARAGIAKFHSLDPIPTGFRDPFVAFGALVFCSSTAVLFALVTFRCVTRLGERLTRDE